MKRALVALTTALLLLVPASPAQATERGKVCNNYEHGVGSEHQEIRICIAVNVHDWTLAKEGWLDIDVIDSGGAFINVMRDYLRLYKGASVVKTNNWDSAICLSPDFGCAYTDHYHASTDWFTPCDGQQQSDFWSSFRFRIRFGATQGTYGNWKNISSNTWTSCS